MTVRRVAGIAVLTVLAGLSIGAGRQAPPAASPHVRSLFDGRTLDGWEGDRDVWRVEHGAITGGSLTRMTPHTVFLASTRPFSDFVLRLRVRVTGRDGFVNSGIQIRSQRVDGSTDMAGYQCDLGDPDYWGSIYDESRRDRVLSASNMPALSPALRPTGWNDYVIRADGPRITTWINGVMAADYRETDPAIPLSGHLGIQIHGGGTTLVEVTRVSIDEQPTSR